MYTCATMAYNYKLTDICGVQKQEKSIQTSNKHFMKNVKECRDVNRQSIRTKVGMLSSHITPFGPHSALTFLTVHIPTFLYIFHEMFFITCHNII